MQQSGVGPDQAAKHENVCQSQERDASLAAVPSRPLPLEQEPAEENRKNQDGRHQTAGEGSTHAIADQQSHDPTFRSQTEKSPAQEEKGCGCVHCHLAVGNQRLTAIKIMTKPQPANDASGKCEALEGGYEPALAGKEKRAAEHNEVEGCNGTHAGGRGERGRFVEPELIHAKAP